MLVASLNISADEWRALRTLVEAWPNAELITAEGWVTILSSLRSTSHPGQ